MSGTRNKKNIKKNKFTTNNVKFEASTKGKPKSTTKSDDSLHRTRKMNILKKYSHEPDKLINGEENCVLSKFNSLTLGNNEASASTSTFRASIEEPVRPNDEIPLVMEYCPEVNNIMEDADEDYSGYKYFRTKSAKSIKFTNQVTVLYFSGEDILCESMEPLKKEQEQQLRNKEMRKEHLLAKGPVDNLYLF